MKPVAIFQHETNQGPGYLQMFLERYAIPYRMFYPALGDVVPQHAHDFSGLVVLGSNHSVNDALSWIRAEAAVIQDALRQNCPVLGHCFGGQLLAKTLGAEVISNPSPQIGWEELTVTHHPQARACFGEREQIRTFLWHYQSFTLPTGATRLLYGRHSLNKGFSLGRHLALQCHLEVTAETVRAWCMEGYHEIVTHMGETVQGIDVILRDLPTRMAMLHQVSERVYGQWSRGLIRPTRVSVPQTFRSWHPVMTGCQLVLGR